MNQLSIPEWELRLLEERSIDRQLELARFRYADSLEPGRFRGWLDTRLLRLAEGAQQRRQAREERTEHGSPPRLLRQ